MNSSALVWQPPPGKPSLPADEVQVWRAALDVDAAQMERLWDLLSVDERERADRFRFPIHRARFIAARGLLRLLLGRYLNAAPAGLRFEYGPHGKPALAAAVADGGLRFNLAHSEGLALVAFAQDREVGVDLESHGRAVAQEEIAERFFSPAEAAALRALPVELRRQGFFNCWTRKEAFLKATGRGLSLPLRDFTVSLAPGEPARLLANQADSAEYALWELHDILVGESFSAALAVEGQGSNVQCWSLVAKESAELPV